MCCLINGKSYLYRSDIRDDGQIRESFFALARRAFGLDFATWYQNGWWGGDYIPHVLLDNGHVAANVSVNLFHTRQGKKLKTFIQLGTVMTGPEYRNQGLGRFLLEKVLEEWTDECTAVYLFANNGVLDYYPKFGFERAEEYQSSLPVKKRPGKVRKLNMDNSHDRELLFSHYTLSNPFSALPMIDNPGLLMFYCGQSLKNQVYFLKDFDAVVIAEQHGDTLLCYDVFCPDGYHLGEVLSAIARETTRRAVLGFSPKDMENCAVSQYKEEDTTLFFLQGKENPMAKEKLMFPFLSHA